MNQLYPVDASGEDAAWHAANLLIATLRMLNTADTCGSPEAIRDLPNGGPGTAYGAVSDALAAVFTALTGDAAVARVAREVCSDYWGDPRAAQEAVRAATEEMDGSRTLGTARVLVCGFCGSERMEPKDQWAACARCGWTTRCLRIDVHPRHRIVGSYRGECTGGPEQRAVIVH